MRATFQSVCISTDEGKVVLTVHGLRLELDPVDALQVSDSLRVMANRAITPINARGSKAVGNKTQ